ncbi:preprotein translocase subunit SecG [Coraliomargarita parva]|uniref:preprotein translocase subunit SecG n=1 Tax=Coraliomargarita parva TaxID=3014050 RepID=UPI0022B3A839|nr:preprotein translocase subunit SecG [Coraliomargarita parva]
MGPLLISLLTLVLILISAFVVLIILMQRTSQSGGMGAALGGGAAESAFGSETTNILTKGTIYGIISFFVISLCLFLLYQSEAKDQLEAKDPTLLVPGEAEEAGAETSTSVIDLESLAEGTSAAVSESVEVPAEESTAPTTEAPAETPAAATN